MKIDFKRFTVSVLIIVLIGFLLLRVSERVGFCFNEINKNVNEYGVRCIENLENFTLFGIFVLFCNIFLYPTIGYVVGVYFYFQGKRREMIEYVKHLALLIVFVDVLEMIVQDVYSSIVVPDTSPLPEASVWIYIIAIAITLGVWLLKNAISGILGGVIAYLISRKSERD